MNTPLKVSMAVSGCGSSTLTNCGRNARKKIESFGLRMLIRIASTVICAALRAVASFSTLSVPCSRSVFQAM